MNLVSFAVRAFSKKSLPGSALGLAAALACCASASAAAISLNASDGLGASSFAAGTNWVGGAAPAAGNTYTIGSGLRLRTPGDAASYVFAGNSLTIANGFSTASINTTTSNDLLGFTYKGTGTTGVITINNLILAGGSINHLSGAADVFRIAGGLSITAESIIRARQGPITITAAVSGSALLQIGASDVAQGIVTLAGVNTFTGNINFTAASARITVPDTGNLNFVIGAAGVNNKITGAGVAVFNGKFNLDLTGASTTIGDSWTLVDAAAVVETYGATFSITGFTESNNVWIGSRNGVYYRFDEATSVLSVIETPPTFPNPTITSAPRSNTVVVGSNVTLSVGATGLGNLTYQWAKAGSPLSGATTSTLNLSNVQLADSAVYSVTVTDDAAVAGGQAAKTTTVEATITVIAAADASVAYYRFEDGTAGSTLSTALDSTSGANNQSAVGALTYVAATPYAKVPRTLANDTLAANFPAAGSNGLVASASGGLAATQLTSFTIETFVRFSTVSGIQTLIGRDDAANPGEGLGPQSLFYFQKNSANAFRVELITKSNTNISIAGPANVAANTWYHVAAVGDAGAGTLTLYVNGVAVGSVTGFNGLLVPTAGSDTPWTLGRGDYNALDADFFRGDLDEVRFSRVALPPTQFLNSDGTGPIVNPTITQAPTSRTVRAGSDTSLNVAASGAGTLSYQWFKDNVAIGGQTSATLNLPAVATTASGTYSVKVSDAAGTPLGIDLSATSSAVLRVLALPAAGRRVIGLNFSGASSGGNFSTELGTLASGQSAGFYASADWNNTAGGVATQTIPMALHESNSSTAAGATATWTSANTWAARTGTGVVAAKTPDTLLLHGYVESRASTGATVTVSNIPYASYEAYVYVAGGIVGNVGSVTVNGGVPVYFRVLQHDSYVVNPVPTAETPYTLIPMVGDAVDRAAALAAPAATFVRFTGLSGSDLTIAAIDQTLNANAGGIAAVQIVDTTPVGAAYPPTVTSAPVSRFVKGGASVSFSVAATPVNAGSLTYAWSKDGAAIPSATSATLNLGAVAGSATGRYTVTVTETSGLGAGSTTRSADLVVVDSTRSLLLNGDVGTASASNPAYSGALLPDGTVAAANAGLSVSNTWNHLATAAGAGTGVLSREASGLSIPGVTFAYAGAEGSLDDATNGAIDTTGAAAGGAPLLRDFAYTDSQTTPMTMRVGGLQAFAGHRVQLVVYAVGVLTNYTALGANDAAAVTLDPANNHLGSGTLQTDNSQGRDLRYTNAFVAFEGVVAADGTVGWSFGPDVDAGRIPANGFQLLVTGTLLAPAAPTNLVATPGNAQVGLSWTASSGASTYTILRSTTAGGPYAAISSGLATTYTDSSAVNGTTYYYVVSAVGSNAVLASGYSNQASATPAAAVSALEAWRQLKFGAEANTPAAANTADYDNDGLANLLEYALGTEPKTASASPLLTGRSGDFLTLSFPHGADSTLVYHIDSSNDLAGAWTLDVAGRTFATVGTYLHTDTVGLSTQPRRFLRLRVTTP